MPTLAEDQATILSLRALLNSGTTQMAENGRMMRFDLGVVRQQLSDAEARVAAAQNDRPQVRRLLMIQHGKGL